jgi:hypothetical protein
MRCQDGNRPTPQGVLTLLIHVFTLTPRSWTISYSYKECLNRYCRGEFDQLTDDVDAPGVSVGLGGHPLRTSHRQPDR